MAGLSSDMIDDRDMLNQAVQAASEGDFARARSVAEKALEDGRGDPAAFHGFLGMICARSGELSAAIQHLEQAHALRPQDITIACNLVSILMDQKREVDALEVASAELMRRDESLRVARFRGFLAQNLEEFSAAVEAYELIVAQQPGDFECWNNLGNARAGLGEHEKAETALRRAIAIDPGAAPARLNLASALEALDRLEEAEAELVKAIDEFPDESQLPYRLYIFYKAQLKQEEALAALLKASDRDPDSADIWLKLGIEHGVLRQIEEAERAYRRAIELDPGAVDAYLGLAIQFEHSNREEEFAPLIARAEANGVDDGALGFLRALEHRRAGQFAEGLEALSKVPAEIETERSAHIRATLLDRLGRSQEAFAAFEEAARLHEDNPTEPLRRAAELRHGLCAELDLLTPEWISTWSPDKAVADRPDPVFLAGFPRSGTTLLDTILMGHPDATVLEEQPPLNIVDETIGGLTRLPALETEDIARARRKYFAEVERIGDVPASNLLIDKSPLFLQKVPLIQRLFPHARFILAMRHPCDVLLSCFMSNFRLNSAMSNFLRLEDAAQFYDLTFRHWQRSCELFPTNVHVVKYENLVEDVEAEVRPLFDFLGLEWRDQVLDHQRTAKARGLITTASYSQVTEPIYKRASGRWTRYRENLEPVLPVLEPWVRRYGYSL